MHKRTHSLMAAGAVLLLGVAGPATPADAVDGRWGWGGRDGGCYGQQAGWGGRQGRCGHRGMRGRAGMRGGPAPARLLERFDTDKDGKLTQDELDAARKALLAKHDKDGDGKLTLAEFETLWLDAMNARMVRGFQRLDRNGDAVVTPEEFLAPYGDAVKRLDRNGDGAISLDDRQPRGGKRGRGRW